MCMKLSVLLANLVPHLLHSPTDYSQFQRILHPVKGFSEFFGHTLTKLRTHLKVQTLTELTELKMHVRDEHIRTVDTKQRLKRRFGFNAADATLASRCQPLLLITLVSIL